jgi:hypothetical protein
MNFHDVEPEPGLAEIKQCELYLKWRPFAPGEFKDQICSKPSKEVLEKIKSD